MNIRYRPKCTPYVVSLRYVHTMPHSTVWFCHMTKTAQHEPQNATKLDTSTLYADFLSNFFQFTKNGRLNGCSDSLMVQQSFDETDIMPIAFSCYMAHCGIPKPRRCNVYTNSPFAVWQSCIVPCGIVWTHLYT